MAFSEEHYFTYYAESLQFAGFHLLALMNEQNKTK